MDTHIATKQCPTCAGQGSVPDLDGPGLRLIRDKARTPDGSKVTQQAVAREMGITPSALCDIEHGRRRENTIDPELVSRFLSAVEAVQKGTDQLSKGSRWPV